MVVVAVVVSTRFPVSTVTVCFVAGVKTSGADVLLVAAVSTRLPVPAVTVCFVESVKATGAVVVAPGSVGSAAAVFVAVCVVVSVVVSAAVFVAVCVVVSVVVSAASSTGKLGMSRPLVCTTSIAAVNAFCDPRTITIMEPGRTSMHSTLPAEESEVVHSCKNLDFSVPIISS